MNEHRSQGQKASANPIYSEQGNEADTRQESVSRRPAKKKRKNPSYDPEHRELRAGGTIIKCLTQASDAQEIILLAFQEENWPYRIDDPLAGKTDQEPKERLRRAVDNLNRRQRPLLIQFGVAGQGTAVTWQFREERR